MKILLTLLCCISLSLSPAWTIPPEKESIIRDAEIEEVLRSFTNPIFEAADLNPKSISLYVLNSPDVNAFAAGGGLIILHTALLLRATSVLQVIGVLAHETAHVADHHIIRGMEAYRQAVLQSLLGTLAGIAVGAASKKPEAGTAILMGSMDAAARGYLKYSRTQEGSADQGAVRYLDRLEWPAHGLLEFMNILHHGDLLVRSGSAMDPYLLTHPLLEERISFFRKHLEQSRHKRENFPKKFEDDFHRIQVKLKAFIQPPLKTLGEFPPTDTSLLGRYARSIAYLQNSQSEESLKEINCLLKDHPQDPFFWDLKGQILFESGKVRESVTAYEKAVALRPDIPILYLALAHALVESDNVEKAFPLLLRAKTEEPDSPLTYRLLAVCYGKQGNTGLAALSLAEMALQIGDFKQAVDQANRAIHFLKGDEVNLTRAKDVLEEVERQKKAAAASPF